MTPLWGVPFYTFSHSNEKRCKGNDEFPLLGPCLQCIRHLIRWSRPCTINVRQIRCLRREILRFADISVHIGSRSDRVLSNLNSASVEIHRVLTVRTFFSGAFVHNIQFGALPHVKSIGVKPRIHSLVICTIAVCV